MRILFLTPIGGRTGSEICLWHIIKHLTNSTIEAVVYSKQDGDLFKNSPPAVHTFQHKWKRNFFYHFFETVCHKLTKKTPEQWYVKYIHRKFKPQLWYLNTMTMPEFADMAHEMSVPYVVHVHEMLSLFDTQKSANFIKMLANAKMVIACSKATQKILEDIQLKNVHLLTSFLDLEKIKITKSRTEIREELRLPKNAFVWVMSGSISMRKGIDFVPDLLRLLPQNHYLVWLGADSIYMANYYSQRRVEAEKLNFIALGSKNDEDYYNYFNICDGFVLLSREEPFGLVMVEAAYLGKPIVSFDSGGPSEFVQEEMGKVIKCFDLVSMSEEMILIANNKTVINIEKLKARAMEFDIQNQLPKWQKLIETLKLN